MRITGRVQRVFFRAFTKEKAEELGLVGTVENKPDGSVEVVAQGKVENLEKLTQYLKEGPSAADVNNIEQEKVGVETNYSDFKVIG